MRDLVPVCCWHHHVTHELGRRLDLAPDRTLTVPDSHGAPLFVTGPDTPPGRSRESLGTRRAAA